MNQDQAIEAGFTHEVTVSHVPEGARTEDYLGGQRYFTHRDHAQNCADVADQRMMQNPENFEPEMEFGVETL